MHYDQLFELDLSTKETVEAIMDGHFNVDGYDDNLQLAEDYLIEIESRYYGEDTSKAWQVINYANVL